MTWLQSVAQDAIYMAPATVGEIQCGIGLVQDRQQAREAQKWLDDMIRDGHPQVAEFSVRAAVLLGQMWAVAAVAISRGMTVVTGNVDEFLEIGAVFPLPGLLNPFTPMAA